MGEHYPERIGWNESTGASAVNLAMRFGAKTIVLLGFDMKLDGMESNWHPNDINAPNPEIFERFIGGCRRLKEALDERFPEVRVWNANPDSALNVFPKIPLSGALLL